MNTINDWKSVMKSLAEMGCLPKTIQCEHEEESAFVPHAYDAYTVRSKGQILLASLDIAVSASDKKELQAAFSTLKDRMTFELNRDGEVCMRHIATMATDMWAIQQEIEMIDDSLCQN